MPSELIQLPNIKSAPHWSQYFGEWAMQADPFRQLCDAIRSTDISAHLTSAKADQARARDSVAADSELYSVSDGIATISLSGPLMKHVSSVSAGTSTVLARRAMRFAADDPNVHAIVMQIDSPGGTVAGTKDLADDISTIDMRKPVYAYIEDLGASAAYWIASQARRVYANSTALVGSIGTYGVVVDSSAAAMQQGIKVHVLKAGQYKGAGIEGTPISDDQLDNMQTRIDELNAHFKQAVQKGRLLTQEQVNDLADGQVHLASQAQALGLIDGVKSIDEMFAEAYRHKPKPTSGGQRAMSQTIETAELVSVQPTSASIAELKTCCPNASEKFLLEQLEKAASVESAKTAFISELSQQVAAKDEEITELKSELESAKKSAETGHAASSHTSDEAADYNTAATDEWNTKVNALVQSGKSISQARSIVNKQNPGLRQRMLDENN